MSINGISSVTANVQTAYTSNEVTSKEKKEKDTSAASSKDGVVYEKSSNNASTSTVKKSYTTNSALVEQLKADQEKQQQNLLAIVQKTLNSQVTKFGQANSGIISTDDMWKFLASGNFEVDAETKAQAQKDIADDGYWGVSQTSERILDFANALTGGDPDQIEKMRNAFLKGYKQAQKTWGGELPEISKKTYQAVLDGFDKMAEEAGITLSDAT